MIAKIDKLLPPGFHHQEGHHQLTFPPRERARLERGGNPEEQGEASQGDNTRMEARTCFPALSLENMQEEI